MHAVSHRGARALRRWAASAGKPADPSAEHREVSAAAARSVAALPSPRVTILPGRRGTPAACFRLVSVVIEETARDEQRAVAMSMRFSHRAVSVVASLAGALCLGGCSKERAAASSPHTAAQFAIPLNAEKLPSGLRFVALAAGTGQRRPAPGELVRVAIVFRSGEGRPIGPRPRSSTFRLGKALHGWQQVVPRMVLGQRLRVWLPGPAAGQPAMIDVELAEIASKPVAPVSLEPPGDAVELAGGVKKAVLRPGAGPTPSGDAIVAVHFSGWSQAGELFETSRTRAAPLRAPLRRMIRGWQQALVGMRAGERSLVWIPEALAYPNHASRPRGRVVFELELIAFRKQTEEGS